MKDYTQPKISLHFIEEQDVLTASQTYLSDMGAGDEWGVQDEFFN